MTTRTTLAAALLLAPALLWPAPARAQLSFTLDAPDKAATPGRTLAFSGTLTNTGAGALFLNGDTFTLSGAAFTLDDTPFLTGAPTQLAGGDSFAGELFDVTVAPGALPQSGAGSFTVLGGATDADQTALATARFSVAAVPEPSALALLALALPTAGGMALARRRSTAMPPGPR